MILNIIDHSFHYETEKLTGMFFPYEKLEMTRELTEKGNFITTKRIKTQGDDIIYVKASVDGISSEKSAEVKKCDEYDAACERKMAVLLFDILSDVTGYRPDWGILTGVRPAKLMNMLIEKNGEEKAKSIFKNELMVSPEKTELAFEVAKKERRIISLSRPCSFSLYVSIPFCPSRCSYCSFVSQANEQAKKLMPEYVEKLCEEIKITGDVVKKTGLMIESVYWGGGTPTTLSADMYERVSKTIEESFDLSSVREYTVEAGRPDSVSSEKLRAVKESGATRISINPQTFNDGVLREIGRKHTSQETKDAFLLARKEGFDNINMDIIAGLPTDTLEGFMNTVDTVLSFAPESVTVHTLALKRSSYIVTEGRQTNRWDTVRKMLSFAFERLYSEGYRPYYMYRQSKCLGNFENVGFVKEGFECLYNVFMMEECHTVLSVGAGGVTKLKNPYKNEIERVYNFKYPYEYIGRFNEIAERKNEIISFYEKI